MYPNEYGQKYDKEIVELEKAILSSIIFHFKEISDLINIDSIHTSHFVTIQAKRLFQSIKNISPTDGKYDPVLILNKLKQYCFNDSDLNSCVEYLENLPRNIQFFSIKRYLNLLNDNKIKKDLNFLARSILSKNLSDEKFNDVLEQWKYRFNEIVSQTSATNYLSAKDAVDNFDDLVNSVGVGNSRSFLKTNYVALDRKIKALSGGQLIIIASRPGVGKTTFAINLIYNNFENIDKNLVYEGEKPPAIGVFSLEMTTSSLLAKLLAIDANVELSAVQNLIDGGYLENYKVQLIEASKKKVANLNLLFCDESNITVGKITSTIKTWVREYDIKFIVIDYLQLVNTADDRRLDNTNQYQKIGMISRSLKILAMELNICIVSLAQLNRKSEERKGPEKSPILSDLRESGSIEQDADIVMFIYEKKLSQDDKDDDFSSQEESSNAIPKTVLKIAKNRHGPIGEIEFIFDKFAGTYKLSN